MSKSYTKTKAFSSKLNKLVNVADKAASNAKSKVAKDKAILMSFDETETRPYIVASDTAIVATVQGNDSEAIRQLYDIIDTSANEAVTTMEAVITEEIGGELKR